jgi:hypothetical protein
MNKPKMWLNKNALKTENHKTLLMIMNEIAEKHFKYREPQKHVRIPTMNENQKLFAHFLGCTR